MIKIENTEVFGWEAAIRGMRSPKNSWDRRYAQLLVGKTGDEWHDFCEWIETLPYAELITGGTS